MKKALGIIGLVSLLILSAANLEARDKRVRQIPNGTILQCAACHFSEQDTRLNSFGNIIYKKYLTSQNSAGNVIWNAALANLDSDGDGFTNGTELGDPNCMWKAGNPNPGDPAKVYFPGDASSHPTLSSVISNYLANTTNEVSAVNVSPNPVISSVNLVFTLNNPSNVRIDVVNTNGTIAGNILNTQFLNSGDYSFNWNPAGTYGQQLVSDVYFIRIITSDAVLTKKIIVR